ncbi:MAG: hypothetical protein IJT94_17780 [Oscillibacter sp.]|nr:hypothetical protein [Oscillibacter sp.]
MVNLNHLPRLSHLRSGLVRLAGMVVDAIEELDGVKLDKPEILTATLPATGWSSDNTAGYPYYYDLTVTGVTAADIVIATLTPASIVTATACGMCPANESRAGVVRFRANAAPAQAIELEYEIGKGSE